MGGPVADEGAARRSRRRGAHAVPHQSRAAVRAERVLGAAAPRVGPERQGCGARGVPARRLRRAPRRSQRHREVSDVSVLLPADAERAGCDRGELRRAHRGAGRGRAHLGDVLLRADMRGTGMGKGTRARAAAPRATLFFVRTNS